MTRNETEADDTPPDETEAILTALGRLRGRRRPGPRGGPEGDPGRGDRGHGPRAHGSREHGGSPWAGDGPGRLGGPARFRVLEILAAIEEPLSVSEIGQRVGVDQPRASRLVQQIVEHGLAERQADPDDARRTRIALTNRGRRMATGMRGERRDHIAAALADFSDDERSEFVRLLIKFADAWPQD